MGVDWWALGILIYEMIVGNAPFYGDTPFETYERILEGYIDFPDFVKEEARDIIGQLLIADDSRRLGCRGRDAEEVEDHAFFNSVDWAMAREKKFSRVPWQPRLESPGDARQFRRANSVDKQLAAGVDPHDIRISNSPQRVSTPCGAMIS